MQIFKKEKRKGTKKIHKTDPTYHVYGLLSRVHDRAIKPAAGQQS